VKRPIINIARIVFIGVALVVANGAVWASAITLPYVYTYETDISISPIRHLEVTANVEWVNQPGFTYDQHYKYTYSVKMLGDWGLSLSNFTVGDPGHLEWEGAFSSSNFSSASYVAADTTQQSVSWTLIPAVGYQLNRTVQFGYYSLYGYSDDTVELVSSTAGGGGKIANGLTVGMVPEPATLAGLGFGLTGMTSCLVRAVRRRRRQ
jgi:hypothetical protein